MAGAVGAWSPSPCVGPRGWWSGRGAQGLAGAGRRRAAHGDVGQGGGLCHCHLCRRWAWGVVVDSAGRHAGAERGAAAGADMGRGEAPLPPGDTSSRRYRPPPALALLSGQPARWCSAGTGGEYRLGKQITSVLVFWLRCALPLRLANVGFLLHNASLFYSNFFLCVFYYLIHISLLIGLKYEPVV